jgi:hypothetical protein
LLLIAYAGLALVVDMVWESSPFMRRFGCRPDAACCSGPLISDSETVLSKFRRRHRDTLVAPRPAGGAAAGRGGGSARLALIGLPGGLM